MKNETPLNVFETPVEVEVGITVIGFRGSSFNYSSLKTEAQDLYKIVVG